MSKRKRASKMKKGKTISKAKPQVLPAAGKVARKPGLKTLLNPIIVSIIAVYFLILAIYVINVAPKKVMQESLETDKAIMLKSIEEATNPDLAGQASAQNVITFIVGQEVDKDKLQEFAQTKYSDLKKQLGLTNDFCIHFEDQDGNLIDISELTGRRGAGIGSPELEFNVIDDRGNPIAVMTC